MPDQPFSAIFTHYSSHLNILTRLLHNFKASYLLAQNRFEHNYYTKQKITHSGIILLILRHFQNL